MPKGYSNPAHANNLPALLTDIRSAWGVAHLTDKQRRALLLKYGFDYRSEDIASIEECSKRAIDARLYVAVGHVGAALNGEPFLDTEDEGEHDQR